MRFRKNSTDAYSLGPSSWSDALAEQDAKQGEEECRVSSRQKAKRVKMKQRTALWSPNTPQPANEDAIQLGDFASENGALFQSAIRIATFAAENGISDMGMRLPISIDAKQASDIATRLVTSDGKAPKEDVYLFLVVHLDHDLYGRGVINIVSDEEFEVVFMDNHATILFDSETQHAPMHFYSDTEKGILDYLRRISEERSEDLQTVRELMTKDVIGEDESRCFSKIRVILGKMLSVYHSDTFDDAEHITDALEERGATFEDASTHQCVRVTKYTSGIRDLLETATFSLQGARHDDPLIATLCEYRAKCFKSSAYLLCAIRDLALCGIVVTTQRTYGGNHVSAIMSPRTQDVSHAPPASPVVNVPLLGYATGMSVSRTLGEVPPF